MNKEECINVTIMGEKAYYAKHIAKNLNLNIETVRRYLRSGKIKSLMYSNQYVVTQGQLDEFLKSSLKGE